MKKIMIFIIAAFVLLLGSCGNNQNNEDNELARKMKEELDDNFKKTDVVIQDDYVLMTGSVFVFEASDDRILTITYTFDDDSYLNLEYHEEIGYKKRDIFGVDLTYSDEGYIVTLKKFPASDVILNCKASITYKNITVSKDLTIKLSGGENMILSSNGWTKSGNLVYSYYRVSSYDADYNGVSSERNYSGKIDLNSMTATFHEVVNKSQSNGKTWKSYEAKYTYDINTGILTVSDISGILGDWETTTINLKMYYPYSQYQTYKDNGWDWFFILPSNMLKVCDDLLVFNGYSNKVTVFYGKEYEYRTIFSL